MHPTLQCATFSSVFEMLASYLLYHHHHHRPINSLTSTGCYNAIEKQLTTTLILVTRVRYNAIIFPAFPDEQIFFQYFSEVVGAFYNMSKNLNDLSCKIVSGVSGLMSPPMGHRPSL
jgi:hypothetical protein